MKKYTIFLSLLVMLFAAPSVFAQEKHDETKGIQFFHGTWDELMAKAKKENKPVFVDAYAVWCGPCKNMAATVFTNEEVGDYFNKNFINYKFDMEKGEGPAFAQKWKVTGYPTMFFFDPSGNLTNRVLGAQFKDGLLEEGKKALNVK